MLPGALFFNCCPFWGPPKSTLTSQKPWKRCRVSASRENSWFFMNKSRFWKNIIFHQIWSPKKHPKSWKKLPKVSPRDLMFLSLFLNITLGSQSALPDLHFEPSGIDFGPKIHIISRAREKDSGLESQSSKMGGGGDSPHGVFNNTMANG